MMQLDNLLTGAGSVLMKNGIFNHSILQVKQIYSSTPSTQYCPLSVATPIVGLGASIKTKSNLSRVLVYVRWAGESGTTAYDAVLGLRRNNIDIGLPAANGIQTRGMTVTGTNYLNDQVSTPEIASFWYLDSPNLFGDLTYEATWINTSSAGTLYNNRTVNDSASGGYEHLTSNIILFEIGI